MISSINSIDHSFLFYWCKSGFICVWDYFGTILEYQGCYAVRKSLFLGIAGVNINLYLCNSIKVVQ